MNQSDSERTRITRLREKGNTDRGELDALLDTARVGHLGVVRDGMPLVMPTAIARAGDHVLMHGSTGSGWMRLVADGAPVCLTVTELSGLVVARSAFESSLHYRSAVLFGNCAALAGDELAAALDSITEVLLPGRTGEVRRPTARELRATSVLALPITEWSLKISANWPDDVEEDIADDAWAGVVPMDTRYGAPRPAPDLRAGIPVPDSVLKLPGNQQLG